MNESGHANVKLDLFDHVRVERMAGVENSLGVTEKLVEEFSVVQTPLRKEGWIGEQTLRLLARLQSVAVLCAVHEPHFSGGVGKNVTAVGALMSVDEDVHLLHGFCAA